MKKKGTVWREDQPIYRQIEDVLIARLIEGTYSEGELMPSVRQVADEFKVSPLTAAKVLQEIDKANVTIKKRGIGSEVRSGARNAILKRERNEFLQNEWPQILVRLKRLEIDVEELLTKDR